MTDNENSGGGTPSQTPAPMSSPEPAQPITESQEQRAIKALLGSGAAALDPNQGLLAQMQPVSGDAPPDAQSKPVTSAQVTSPPPPPPPPPPEAGS
jgi:hypothetical protein